MTAERVSLTRGLELALGALSRETGLNAQTLVKRFKAQGVYPSGNQGTSEVYRLSDVFRALLGWARINEPESLPPADRKAHYQAEREKLRLLQDQGLVVSKEDLRAQLALMVRLLTDFLDVLPDRLEREEGIGPEALAHIEAGLDEIRHALADQIEGHQEEAA